MYTNEYHEVFRPTAHIFVKKYIYLTFFAYDFSMSKGKNVNNIRNTYIFSVCGVWLDGYVCKQRERIYVVLSCLIYNIAQPTLHTTILKQ